MKLRPLQDRVVVRRNDAEEKTAGGIVIPDTAKEKPAEGTVVAVGPGKKLEDGSVRTLDVLVGDQVLFGQHGGTEVRFGDEVFLVMREEDIVAVVGAEKTVPLPIATMEASSMYEEAGVDEGSESFPSAEGGTHGPGGGGDD